MGRQGFQGRYQGRFQSLGRFPPSGRFPSPNRFPSPGRFQNRPLTCFNCGRPSHIARLCRDQLTVGYQYNGRPQQYANEFEVFDASDNSYYDSDPWYMDSGATGHVIGNSINLQEIHPTTSAHGIMTAGRETYSVQSTGSSNVQLDQ